MAYLGFGSVGQDGGLNLQFVAPLLLVDTALLIGLILLFLRAHGERPRQVFLGDARWRTELRAALPMVGVAYAIALTVMLGVGALAPRLHTVEKNPLQNLLLAPSDAAIFAIATGILGAFWGIAYLRRRSVVAPVVSHAAFDLLQIAVFLVSGR
jgi:hypothetical protein